ncbi:hypothetical protein CKA32_005382 [Geitlerinema sp. FC II]|nr:hypothetical protein CKA32_005382 [Geitlerinema sp. FC II]
MGRAKPKPNLPQIHVLAKVRRTRSTFFNMSRIIDLNEVYILCQSPD